MDTEAYSEVALRLSAKDLPNADTLSKSDPFAVVYMKTGNSALQEIGRTEVIQDNLNPLWIKSLDVIYHFEELQDIEIHIYDEDKKGSPDLGKHQKLGQVSFRLGNLMASSGQSMVLGLNTKASAKVTIHGEELAVCSDYVTLGLAGSKLSNKDGFFGKSDPFYRIFRLKEGGEYMQIFQSAVIKTNLSPRWLPYHFSVKSLCNGDYDARLKIEICDYNTKDSYDFMGEVETSLRELLVPNTSFDVIEPKKKLKSKSYKNSGTLTAYVAACFRVPSFADYLKGGLQLGFTVAVDYTGSNGNYHNANSLHYLGGNATGQFNQYQNAIASIGPIIEPYDHDGKFSAYGFGARPDPKLAVSHCFPLAETPEVDGIQGIMNAYTIALSKCRLSGPTLFGPVIQAAMAQAEAQKLEASETGKQSYSVLLILTDGVINDMATVKRLLVDASELPLSIIIVGVGAADFTDMNELDGDDNTNENLRDLVQFVAMKDYANGADGARLAKDTLIEVPKQVTDYFKKQNIMPSTPTEPDTSVTSP